MTRRSTILRFTLSTLVLWLSLMGFGAVADEQLDTPVPSEISSAKNQHGWTFAGFPIFNYTSERGLGYGAVAFAIDRGMTLEEDEPFKLSLGGMFYQTTNDYQFHKLLLDWRDLGGTGAQVSGFIGYEAWPDSPYFGNGGRTRRMEPDSIISQEYSDKSLWFVPQAFIPIHERTWWVTTGLTSRSVWLEAGEQSLLSALSPRGSQGGHFLQLYLGLQYSLLERSLTPNDGWQLEWSVRAGAPWLGSKWTSMGTNMTYRQVVPFMSDGKLNLAWLMTADLQEGEPFFQSYWLGNSLRTPLGGHTLLRGYPMGRVRGNFKTAISGELRWAMFEHKVFSKPLRWFSAMFSDVGWIADWQELGRTPEPLLSGGFGLRWLFDNVFLLRLDVALAMERYTDKNEEGYTGVSHGVYFVVNLPF